MKFQSNAIFNGTITANSVADAGTNTDKFLVLNSSGIVTYRTAAELYADLNIANLPAGSTSTVKHLVKAGVAVTKGQAVYVTSADGTNMIIGKASNASEATSSKTMGLIESTLAINGQGNVITEGLLAGLDTTGANAAGDPVWLGVDGNLIYGLANKPYAPAHLVFIGIVTRINANNGEIFVKVQNGFELKEIHDVDLITTTPVNGHILGYNGTLWVNKTIAGWLGFTPVTSARTLTINGVSYDLSADRSWTIEGGGGGTSASTRTVQKYTADGTTATYTVTGGYTVGMVDVYVNGIKLDNASGVEFTATNGTTVVLTSTPASGDIVEVYKYGSQFIANNALRQVTAFTATAGQTVFTVSYSVGYVDVFYNGSKLAASEYTATNGTSITLGTACVVNDIVEVVAYSYTVGAFTGIGGSGTATYIPKFTASGTIGNSSIFDNGTSVGIGTSSPSSKLEVSGTIRSTTQTDPTGGTGIELFYRGADSASYIQSYDRTNSAWKDIRMFGNNLIFGTSDTERMRITSSGNVGIGTTNPTRQLFVNSTAFFDNNGDGSTTNPSIAIGSTSVGLSYIGGGNLALLTGGTERMRIRSGGEIQIGNTSDNVLIANDSLGTWIENSSATSTKRRIRIQALNSAATNYTTLRVDGTNSQITFETADTERMRITSGGNVLVGMTTDPIAGVIVGSQSDNNWTIYGRNTASTGNMYVYLAEFINQSPNNSGHYFYYGGDQTNQRFSVRSNGGVYNYSANNVNLSDISTKKDIIPCESYWDKFKSIEIVKFKYIDQTHDDYNIGVIAQQVEKVAPEFIDEENWGKDDGESKIMKAVYTEDLHHATIKVLQEAMAKIESQQQQIDDLKKLIN